MLYVRRRIAFLNSIPGNIMKFLIFSDLHGDANKLEKMLEVFNTNQCDKILFLGDLLYHGPRNDLPKGYNPKKVISEITPFLNKMILIKGNCDAEVDSMVLSNKHFYKQYTLDIEGTRITLAHGHHLSKYDPSIKLSKDSYVFYGHYHVFDVTKIDGITYIGIGSISIPKDGIAGYAILNNKELRYYSEDNKLIKVINL